MKFNEELLNEKLHLIEKLDNYLDNQSIGPTVNRQFGDISSSNIKGWLEPISFEKKFLFRESLKMTLEEYNLHRHYNLLNMRAIGISYDTLFTAFVLNTSGRKKYAAAYTLGASIYENIFLAGFKPERLPILEVVTNLSVGTKKNVSSAELISYFVDCMNDLGFDLNKNQYQLSSHELANLYLQCAALNKVRNNRKKDRDVNNLPNVIQELASPIIEYLPLVDLVRGISRGSPDWNTNTPVEQINMMLTSRESHELFQNSTMRKFLNQIYKDYIKLCNLTRMSLNVKAANNNEEEEW